MNVNPLRLLLVSYGAALAAGAGVLAAEAPLVAALAAFWIGGAALTLAIAATAPAGSWLRPALDDDLADETARSMATLARDAAEDRRPAAGPTSRRAG